MREQIEARRKELETSREALATRFRELADFIAKAEQERQSVMNQINSVCGGLAELMLLLREEDEQTPTPVEGKRSNELAEAARKAQEALQAAAKKKASPGDEKKSP